MVVGFPGVGVQPHLSCTPNKPTAPPSKPSLPIPSGKTPSSGKANSSLDYFNNFFSGQKLLKYDHLVNSAGASGIRDNDDSSLMSTSTLQSDSSSSTPSPSSTKDAKSNSPQKDPTEKTKAVPDYSFSFSMVDSGFLGPNSTTNNTILDDDRKLSFINTPSTTSFGWMEAQKSQSRDCPMSQEDGPDYSFAIVPTQPNPSRQHPTNDDNAGRSLFGTDVPASDLHQPPHGIPTPEECAVILLTPPPTNEEIGLQQAPKQSLQATPLRANLDAIRSNWSCPYTPPQTSASGINNNKKLNVLKSQPKLASGSMSPQKEPKEEIDSIPDAPLSPLQHTAAPHETCALETATSTTTCVIDHPLVEVSLPVIPPAAPQETCALETATSTTTGVIDHPLVEVSLPVFPPRSNDPSSPLKHAREKDLRRSGCKRKTRKLDRENTHLRKYIVQY